MLNAVIADFASVANNDGLPEEIMFHCGDGWRAAMYRRRSAFGIEGKFEGCSAST